VTKNPTVFLLPGWLDSGPTHWQSRWEAAHGYTRVQQHDWQRPLRGDWTARLQEVIVNHAASLQAPFQTTLQTSSQPLLNSELLTLINKGPAIDLTVNLTPTNDAVPTVAQRSVILVAHSLGCHLVAAWAAASRHTAVVRGALLVAPPDVTRPDLPPDLYNWRKPILNPLPFPSMCVVSSNDPFGSLDAGHNMAAAWGARCVEAGAKGHINGESGLGDWPAGHALVLDLIGSHI
jgi:uncharacterized protein